MSNTFNTSDASNSSDVNNTASTANTASNANNVMKVMNVMQVMQVKRAVFRVMFHRVEDCVWVQVWGHYKNENDLISWTSCSMWDEGDFVAWNRVPWKTQDLIWEEVTLAI